MEFVAVNAGLFCCKFYSAPISASGLVAAWGQRSSRWRYGFVVRVLWFGFVFRWGWKGVGL